jgi:tetratricopeptide (TPR) repeat protein
MQQLLRPPEIQSVSQPRAAEASSLPWLPGALAAIIALATYGVTIGGTYIYDDVQIVTVDPRIKDPHQWKYLWTKDYFNGGLDNLYRPLVSQSYAFEWWLHGDKPWAFHLVNILLAAAVAALVAELARRLWGWKVGMIAGVLFAAHPVHSEVVAGIVGRAELMCGLGIVGAMILFLHKPMTIPRAWAIGALSVLAMLSKEQGLLMPLLLAILLPLREATDSAERRPMRVLAILLLWSVSGLIVLREEILKLHFAWERSLLDFTIQPMMRSAGSDRWLMPVVLVGHYLQLLLAPIHLSIDYGYAVMGWKVDLADPYLYAGFFAIAAWIALAIFTLYRRRWNALFCLLALAITYSMASNIVLIATNFAERLIYIPSIFFIILISAALAHLPRRIGTAVVMLLLALCLLRTITYVSRWNNRHDFYAYELEQQPRSIRLMMLLSYEDYSSGDLDSARKLMADACAIPPDYEQTWQFAGEIEEKAGNWATALADYRKAFKIQHNGVMDKKIGEMQIKIAEQNPSTQPSSAP